MKKIIGLLLICILALSMAGCGNAEYDTALGLYEAGSYAEAEQILAELGDYKDSIQLRLACRYGQAMQLYETGSYEDAIPLFKKLGSYENSAEMLLASYYAWAQAQQEAGEYESAMELYTLANGYSDSSDRILECRQLYAEQLMADAQYDKALPYLKSLSKAGILNRGSNAVGWCTLAAMLQDTGVYAIASGDCNFTIRMVQENTIEILARLVVDSENRTNNRNESSTMVLDYSVKVSYDATQAEMSYIYSLNTKITERGTTKTAWDEESATASVNLTLFTPENVSWENVQYTGKNQDNQPLTEPVYAMTVQTLSKLYRELDNALLKMDLGISLRDLGFVSLAV